MQNMTHSFAEIQGGEKPRRPTECNRYDLVEAFLLNGIAGDQFVYHIVGTPKRVIYKIMRDAAVGGHVEVKQDGISLIATRLKSPSKYVTRQKKRVPNPYYVNSVEEILPYDLRLQCQDRSVLPPGTALPKQSTGVDE